MHRPFLGVSALLIAISTLIPTQGQAGGSGKPDAPNGSFVEVKNGKIYYEECANAPTTVVLIHDRIAHSVVWDGVWPLFCQSFRTSHPDTKRVKSQKKLLDILTAGPQDLTHDDYPRPAQAALPCLHEIRIPTLLLTSDADMWY